MADTPRSTAALQTIFADGQASTTPVTAQDIRDFVVSTDFRAAIAGANGISITDSGPGAALTIGLGSTITTASATFNLNGGNAATTTSAGNAIRFTGGPGGSTSGAGGGIVLQGGSATSGAGGSISIQSGDGAGTNADGGSITLQAGSRIGSGAAGGITCITDGGNTAFYSTNGNADFLITSPGVGTTTTSRIYTQANTTGNPAIIGSSGSDTNIDLSIRPQGTGSLIVRTNGVERLQVRGDGTISVNANASVLVDTSFNIPVGRLGSGTSASSTTFWRGDATWATPAGSGTVTSVGLAGTANELTVTGSTPITASGSWTLSLPSALTFTGKTVTGGTFSGISLSGTTTSATGGAMTFQPGAAATSSSAGNSITFTGGNGGSSSGNGGAVNFNGGTPISGIGGSLTFSAGAGVGTDKDGGSLSFNAGAKTGVGSPGAINFVTTGGNMLFYSTAGNADFRITSPGVGAVTAARLFVQAATTGNPAILGSSGDDTNVTISVQPQGTGNLVLGSGYRIRTIDTSISAAGTNSQASSTLLAKEVNHVSVAAASSGVRLPVPVSGQVMVVINRGANTMHVYPASGGAIDALGSNAAFDMSTVTTKSFYAISSTQWYSG